MNKSKFLSLAIMALAFTSFTSTQSKSPVLKKKPLSAFNQAMLKRHNYYRNVAGIQELRWNDKLQSLAQNWANTLRRKRNCKMKHSSKLYRRDISGFRYIGENLHWYWSSRTFKVDPSQGVRATDNWYNEIRDFQYSKKGTICARRNKKEAVGHFTQLMWEATSDLGCAYAQCGNNTSIVIVCNYGPAGNFNMRKNPPFSENAAAKLNKSHVNKKFGGLPTCDK